MVKLVVYVCFVNELFGNLFVRWKKFANTRICFLTDIDGLYIEIFYKKRIHSWCSDKNDADFSFQRTEQ